MVLPREFPQSCIDESKFQASPLRDPCVRENSHDENTPVPSSPECPQFKPLVIYPEDSNSQTYPTDSYAGCEILKYKSTPETTPGARKSAEYPPIIVQNSRGIGRPNRVALPAPRGQARYRRNQSLQAIAPDLINVQGYTPTASRSEGYESFKPYESYKHRNSAMSVLSAVAELCESLEKRPKTITQLGQSYAPRTKQTSTSNTERQNRDKPKMLGKVKQMLSYRK